MKQKTFQIAIALCVAVLTLASCGQASNKLKAAAEEANKLCPMDMGDTGEVRSITYEDGAIVYTYDIEEQFASVEALAANPQAMKQNMLTMASNPSGGMKTLIDLVIEANAEMTFVFNGKQSGAQARATLTTEELKQALNADVAPIDKLNAAIVSSNLQMPMQAEEGLTIITIELIGDRVTYICSVDEDLYDIDALIQNADLMKQSMMEAVRGMGAVERQFMGMIVEAGKMLAYKYVGATSGKSLTVDITTQELKNILN